MERKLSIMIMSGVEDGALLEYDSTRGDGKVMFDKWSLTVGRRDENDVCLRNDTYVSRQHAKIHWIRDNWWLEDCESTNGTFINNQIDFFDDQPVKGIIHVEEGQLFRVGRTWMRIQTIE